MEVLAHEAIGYFITHCGWNSVIEGLSLGVPLVAMPQNWDQPTNAKFIEDVWGVGIRTKVIDKGVVGREELMFCIREVHPFDDEKAEGHQKERQYMEDIRSRSNFSRWKFILKHRRIRNTFSFNWKVITCCMPYFIEIFSLYPHLVPHISDDTRFFP
ncbi:hypothetical protein GIB67_023403 [Kingdonia uniflora]|uniref:Uncharacterized protein n=1 Tax=Kingdonia uniflora TaxID=39325 RepID=A0A7J7MIG6_9MAGN|nr:hypothetical protein GIB67_023403 [Kingdonia uniflora]